MIAMCLSANALARTEEGIFEQYINTAGLKAVSAEKKKKNMS